MQELSQFKSRSVIVGLKEIFLVVKDNKRLKHHRFIFKNCYLLVIEQGKLLIKRE